MLVCGPHDGSQCRFVPERLRDRHGFRTGSPAAVQELMTGRPSKTVELYPGKTFPATVTTTSNSVATESRSALVELQAANPDGELWPGSFAEVHFHLEPKANVMHIPATALFFGPRGIEVAVLTPDGRVSFSRVELGRNLGNEAEILSGISPDDTVIDSPPNP
jgi:multidrug efflux pump subunit AcrA (membrane-fusion protein)